MEILIDFASMHKNKETIFVYEINKIAYLTLKTITLIIHDNLNNITDMSYVNYTAKCQFNRSSVNTYMVSLSPFTEVIHKISISKSDRILRTFSDAIFK